MTADDAFRGRPQGLSSIKEDDTLSWADLDGFMETRKMSMAWNTPQTPEGDFKCFKDTAVVGQSALVKILIEAEAAAHSAAIQLVAYKDAMDDEFVISRHLASDKQHIRRHRGLLLEKLEDFKRINKSVRQKLKLLREIESQQIDPSQQIDILMKRIEGAESENELLKRDLYASKITEEELMDVRRHHQEKVKTAVHITKSVEATRAHLQAQLRSKEAEKNRLTMQLRKLELKNIKQRTDIGVLKGSVVSVTAKAAQDKESFKRASQAHKRRAEKFEAAIEKCYTQMREKDVELAKALSEWDLWKSRTERMMEEKGRLAAHIKQLKGQITDLTARLKKEDDDITVANASSTLRIEMLKSENCELGIKNVALKTSVAGLEKQVADTEAALREEKVVSQEREHQAEQCQSQIAELQAEVSDLRIKCTSLVSGIEEMRARRDSEVDKMESQSKLLRSTGEMKESIQEANLQLQEKVNSLQKKMDSVQQENLGLVQRLAAQDQILSYSKGQLEQYPSECQALTQQLETALSDINQQLNKVKDQASSREEALKTQVTSLEAEKSRRETELKLLHQSKLMADKQFKVRLKDLQVSLDQSESHKQSIQNYVDFLKNTYKTMFDDGVHTSTAFSAAYFLK
ncbi:outer dense fiber protein 2-like [Genypterus blacodes]|uniref:outer dense fiber protein 2-like n=1 Tax=Genypterus blacodes TaxID=154954 RepID=UPI003F76D1BB